ncbi:cyclodeaminase/cyclohydrolase family protein [Natronoarchaeum sp. GCM10025321]|uniref:cyclodeaminase/cyclohydrolase family protein n=1 Tax=Natronoarchaeum sp. GCM10025321 TaxID=3252684 RepID=UPI0036135E4B
MTFADQTIGEFLEAIASEQVTPSGGAVAGVGGAMGAALCEMVCIHTIEAGEADPRADLAGVRDTLVDRRSRLLDLADEDAAIVDDVQAAFASGDDDRIQRTSKRATEVPLETATACLDIVEAAVTVTREGRSVAVPDAAVGALLAHAALDGCMSTVHANLAAIDDDEFVSETEQQAAEIEADAEVALTEIRATTADRH